MLHSLQAHENLLKRDGTERATEPFKATTVLTVPDYYYYKRQREHKFALFLLELMHEYLSQHKYVPP